MRVIVGSIWHESNSFSPLRTDLSAFGDLQLLAGDRIIEHHRGRGTEIGGFLSAAEHRGIDIVPTVAASALPSGPVTDEAFRFLKGKLLEGIAGAESPDGVLLALHGAMLTETLDDPEGQILREVREAIGTQVPLGVTLDHHGNVTAQMAAGADFIIGYRTHPHTDQFDVGLRAAELLHRMIAEGVRPAMSVKKVPMLIPQESSPRARARLTETIDELEGEPGVLSASFFIGYPLADIAEVGPCAVVVADGDASLAEARAADFANLMWSLRDDFAIDVPEIEEAIEEALAADGGPYVFCDLGDCLLAGGTGDVTAFLSALLAKGAPSACLALVDPEAVDACIAAGAGHDITVAVGGKSGGGSVPVTVSGRVAATGDGRYFGRGCDMSPGEIEMGRTALVETGGISLVLAEKRSAVHDPALFRAMGIEPARKKIVVVKDAFYTTITYKDIAEKIVFFNSPGLCSWDLDAANYRKVRRPIYPFDTFAFEAHSSS